MLNCLLLAQQIAHIYSCSEVNLRSALFSIIWRDEKQKKFQTFRYISKVFTWNDWHRIILRNANVPLLWCPVDCNTNPLLTQISFISNGPLFISIFFCLRKHREKRKIKRNSIEWVSLSNGHDLWNGHTLTHMDRCTDHLWWKKWPIRMNAKTEIKTHSFWSKGDSAKGTKQQQKNRYTCV